MKLSNPLSLSNRLWASGIFNILAIGTQLVTLIVSRDASSLSPWAFLMFAFINANLAQAGYKNKDWGQFWGMLIGTILFMAIFVLIFCFRT